MIHSTDSPNTAAYNDRYKGAVESGDVHLLAQVQLGRMDALVFALVAEVGATLRHQGPAAAQECLQKHAARHDALSNEYRAAVAAARREQDARGMAVAL